MSSNISAIKSLSNQIIETISQEARDDIEVMKNTLNSVSAIITEGKAHLNTQQIAALEETQKSLRSALTKMESAFPPVKKEVAKLPPPKTSTKRAA